MSGRKHHFIQQMLIKGFSFDHPRDPCHVWAYRRNGNVFSPATEGYGAERDFYGSPERPDLDEQITDLENKRFNTFLSNARETQETVVDANEATAFAIHVMFRSKNLRSMMAEGISQIMAELQPLLARDDVLKKMIASELRRDPRPLLCALRIDNVPPHDFPELQTKLGTLTCALAEKFVATERTQIHGFLNGFTEKLHDKVAAGHRESLRRRINDFSGTRSLQLQELSWRTVTLREPIVLGDSVVFVELADGSFKTATEPNDILRRVLLPVSSHRVLVGCCANEVGDLSSARICQGAAACSFDSFCALDGPDRHAELIPLIRTATFSINGDEAKRIATECLENSLA